MLEECLFIGGPLDGINIIDTDVANLFAEISTNLVIEYIRYKVCYQELYFLDPEYSFVYVKDGLKWGSG